MPRQFVKKRYRWAKIGNGYEVSTIGDRRFSALVATVTDNFGNTRTIEEAYQLDVKGYRGMVVNWREAKGKSAIDPRLDLWGEYLNLWHRWSMQNEQNKRLMLELSGHADRHNYLLTDRFSRDSVTAISQARALAFLLNNFLIDYLF